MSEIGTGLQNATGIRNGMARAGYAFVEASDMRNALARFGTLADWPALRRELERSRGRHLHGRRRPLPPPPLRGLRRGPAGPDRARRAPAALPDARLQHAERRHRALVQAGRPRRSATAPRCAPSSNIAARCSAGWRPRRRAGTSRSTSSASRRGTASTASPRPRACIATASTTCWCCWSTAATSRAAPRRCTTSTSARLGSFTLTDPLDAALVDDARCYHGVTPVEPENPAQPAYRDVLVVTFRKKS